MNSYLKAKSVAKVVMPPGKELEAIVLRTMKTISSIVASTLGPGGRPVLIERQEYGLPHIITKDGVTVFRHLGFEDSTQHVIMETARDAAVKTATSAGDGPQPLWAKILTPTGFIKMEDVRVGMKICGTNGSIQEVVGVYQKGRKEIFKVTLSENRVVECCEDHLWTVTTNYGATKTLTTKEISENFKKNQSGGSIQHRYFTPRTEVEFQEGNELPLDPYVVGVLLGDGSLRDSGTIELSLGNAKEHIIGKLELPTGISTNSTYYSEKHYFRVKIVGKTKTGSTIRDIIEGIGLRNVSSDNKFIPREYLLSSIDNRKKLLQGLIDTDGYINPRGLFEFSTVSPKLAQDFVFLARSLGKSLYVKLHEKTEGDGSYSTKPIYRIHELKGDRFGNKIVNVEKTGKFTEMQCIKVSNPDNLYITDNFIVTHNTTTATILAEAIVRYTSEYCKKNPKVSPTKVVRKLETVFNETILPMIQSWSIEADDVMLRAVAKLSANGDTELADAVMTCFDSVGDDGNISLVEISGPAHYEVELLKGYPINVGYEESCNKFFQLFLNDRSNNRCILEKPIFILYHGALTEIQSAQLLLEKIGKAWSDEKFNHNVIFVATGFSETVLATFGTNFVQDHTINVVPLVAPKSMISTGQLHFLHDLSAVTSAKVFDPLTHPLDTAELADLGYGIESFEMTRYRSTILGISDEDLVIARAEEIKQAIQNAESTMDKQLMEERLGKLTGGVAKLKVFGPSSGELREKRDRAEDAVFAVRGAKKHGALPGGGHTLLKVLSKLDATDDILNMVLAPAFMEPVYKLLDNCGLSHEEQTKIINYLSADIESDNFTVYDAWGQTFVNAVEGGILDSTPAVLEAIRNSISIASLLGTLGGSICFQRDHDIEKQEAMSVMDYVKTIEEN
jgi:chaperonin GroEL (HSP60 family)